MTIYFTGIPNPDGAFGLPVLDPRDVTITGTADPYGSGIVDLSAIPGGLEINNGSLTSPVLVNGPNVRLSRVEQLAGTLGGGTILMNEKNATLVLLSTGLGNGTPGDNMQPNALFCYAEADGSAVWDAVGINAIGKSTSVNARRGTAAYLEGLKDNTTGFIIATEIRSNNQTPSNVAGDSTYNTAGASNTLGAWIACSSHASANQTHGAGVQFGRTGTAQWGVGIGFTSGSVLTTTIRDDTSSVTSILINGSHTTGISLAGTFSGAALAMGEGAHISIGTTTGTKFGLSALSKMGWWDATPVVRGTVTGSRGGNAALASLLSLLATYGQLVDSSTA